MPTPQPIERERKPYVAQPGGGKTYDKLEPTLDQHLPGLRRSDSVQRGTAQPDAAKHKPTPIAVHQRVPPPPTDNGPEARHHRSNSAYHRDQPLRTRSPSRSKDNANGPYTKKSEAEVQYTPSGHYTSGSSSGHHESFDDARRYKEYEAQRERLTNDRYDAARMAAYDPRERERDRDGRPRMQSVSAYDNMPRTIPYPSSTLPNDEDYYRDRSHSASSGSYNPAAPISTGFYPPPHSATIPARDIPSARDSTYGYPNSARYPPNSYKDMS